MWLLLYLLAVTAIVSAQNEDPVVKTPEFEVSNLTLLNLVFI